MIYSAFLFSFNRPLKARLQQCVFCACPNQVWPLPLKKAAVAGWLSRSNICVRLRRSKLSLTPTKAIYSLCALWLKAFDLDLRSSRVSR